MSTKQPFRALTSWRIDNILEINWRIAYTLRISMQIPQGGQGGSRMFCNLKKEQERRGLTDGEMGRIIGVSGKRYGRKLCSGNFRAGECRAFCLYFRKTFDYLFAEEGENLGCETAR